jgi:hypothetical protein
MLKYGFEYCGRPFLFDRVCSGRTPLYCSYFQHEDLKAATCEILLKNGADVNAKTNA